MRSSLMLLKKGFESSSGETSEFLSFFATFKREFTKELLSVGATNIEIKKGHFYVSGFYTIGTQVWYFSLSDVRDGGINRSLMYRKAKDYKDFTGESNRWIAVHTNMASVMHG